MVGRGQPEVIRVRTRDYANIDRTCQRQGLHRRGVPAHSATTNEIYSRPSWDARSILLVEIDAL